LSIKTIVVEPGGGFERVTLASTEPRAPGAGEIAVRLQAAGLVLTETMVKQIQGVSLKCMSPIMLRVKPVDAQGRPVERPCRQGGKALVS
jgi:NADPH:quinone reductase-like Zn-dependent oxidoreductase